MILLDPTRYDEYPVGGLLEAAAQGYIGVDRRLVRSILGRGSAGAADALAFSRGGLENHRVYLDQLLVDVFRHWNTPEALDFLVDVVRRNLEDVTDDLILAFLPFGERAIEPLLKLYEELDENQSSEVAFLLAGLQVRDARILETLLERLEFDASDGAFCLGLYGDPAARPALERILAEVPVEDKELRHEIRYAIDQLHAEPTPYQPQPFDILADYPERGLPPLDELTEAERLEMLNSPDPEARAGAAYTFFNRQLDPKTRQRLLELAQTDPDANVRGRAWMSLADASEDPQVRDLMLAAASDPAREVAERGGAAVGLHGVADRDDVRPVIEELYEEGGLARARALETMWRSIWKPYAEYFPAHLDDPDIAIVRQALRGAGYFQLTKHVDKIASYFDRDGDWEDLREDALFAYALAMPGETSRGRVRGMLRKIEGLTRLTLEEMDLVMFALDERLALHGLDPVFAAAAGGDAEKEAEPEALPKVGRNDPCPCGSGKKYKKCHGA